MKHIIFLSLLFVSLSSSAQITGIWQNWDDKTNEPKAHIEIYQKGSKYHAKVIKLLPAATTTHCNACDGERKGKPLVGMDIFWDLEPYKDYYSNGEIIDPANGKIYSLNVSREGDELNVRGYLGFSLLGRSQKWSLVKE
jgi:uncharacterized protein (DUF2147 family)